MVRSRPADTRRTDRTDWKIEKYTNRRLLFITNGDAIIFTTVTTKRIVERNLQAKIFNYFKYNTKPISYSVSFPVVIIVRVGRIVHSVKFVNGKSGRWERNWKLSIFRRTHPQWNSIYCGRAPGLLEFSFTPSFGENSRETRRRD